MKELEKSIAEGLQQAQDNINRLHVTDLSDEMLTVLLGLMPLLKKWLTDAESEAISRAKNGCCLDGYVLRNSARKDEIVYFGINAYWEYVDVELPGLPAGYVWKLYIDTGKGPENVIAEPNNILLHDRRIRMQGRSVIALVAEKLW